MPRISIDLETTLAFSRSNFIMSARNAFRDTPRSLGPTYWNCKNGSPIGIYFQVSGPSETYGWIVKRLTKALLENNLSHKLLDVSDLGSCHYQMALLHMILEEVETHKAKPPSEGRPINRRLKLLPLIGYFLRDFCNH